MKQVKKVLSVMLVLVMALGLFTGCQPKKEKAVDTSWYKDSETTFTLKKANQLMGLAELAKTKDFAGKTIKLGADIKLNDVNAATMAKWQLGTVQPKNVWTPLGNVDLPFAGIIDGQGHKVSGLYVSWAEDGAGFIGVATSAVELKNIKFVDGMIKNTKNKTGLIGTGVVAKIENVYTNLYVEGSGNFVGGLLGHYTGAFTVQADGVAANWANSYIQILNSWFDGTVSSAGYAKAGFIGGQDARAKVDMINCLATGTINSTREDNYARAGAFFGWMNYSAEYNLVNCVSTAVINSTYTGTDIPDYVGALIGDLGANGLKITNCYGVGKTVIGKDQKNLGLDDDGILKTLDEIKALDVATALPKLEGETASPWQAVQGSTPVLKGLK